LREGEERLFVFLAKGLDANDDDDDDEVVDDEEEEEDD
jgi:hypothetical protein